MRKNTISIPKELVKSLKTLADRYGKEFAASVSYLILQYLATGNGFDEIFNAFITQWEKTNLFKLEEHN